MAVAAMGRIWGRIWRKLRRWPCWIASGHGGPFRAAPLGGAAGKNAAQMLRVPLRAYLLLGVEAELDTFDPQQAMAAVQGADLVVAMSPYQHRAVEYAHVLLPIAPNSEPSS